MTSAGADEGRHRPRGLRDASRLGYHLSLAHGFLVVGTGAAVTGYAAPTADWPVETSGR